MKGRVTSTVHVGLETARYAQILNERIALPTQPTNVVGFVSVMDTGGQTTITGFGQMYENFQKTGKIENYSGYGKRLVTFYEPDFKTAVIRSMNFDETFHGMQYDCCRSKQNR